MTLRLLVLLGFTGSAVFAQFGLFGPVTGHLDAADLAPEIVYTKMLHSDGSSSWSAANLSGKMTVIVFFPDTTDNPSLVTTWNTLIDQFADKPVQFA